jgi:hypothetical protein
MVASGVAEISAAALMEDFWMFTVWKSCFMERVGNKVNIKIKF